MSDSLVSALGSLRPAQRMATIVSRHVLVVSAADGQAVDTALLAQYQPVYTPFALMDQRLLNDLKPAAVVAPLIAESFDALDVALVLGSTGFSGTLYVHSRPLPRADLVMGEIRALCPGMTISLMPQA